MLPGDVAANIEVLDANDRDGNGEKTQRENTKQHHLLRSFQGQVFEGGHGQQKDGDIGNNVPRGVDVDLRRVRHAFGFDGLVPESLDGAADEQRDENLGKGPSSDDNDGDNVDDAHALDGEDSVVLEKKRHFGPKQTGAVEQ